MFLEALAREGVIRKCEAKLCYGKEQPETITTPFRKPFVNRSKLLSRGHASVKTFRSSIRASLE
eukprot:scaffold67145_cov39-Prasinocladus_malaysianus.AAC.1